MIYGYARVSTEEQSSIPTQIAHMQKWAGTEPFTPVEEKGSGKSTDRPQLQWILSKLKKGDTLMVYDTSRLARNTKDALEIISTLYKKECFLNVGGKNIDLTNPTDMLSFSVSASVDTFNREFQNLKSRDGIAAKKQSGDWVLRGDLFGWKTYKTRGQTKAEIDPIAAKYIKYIFEQYATGRAFNDLSKELESVVIPNWEHFHFTACNISRMVQKPIYMGYYTNKTQDWYRIKKISKHELQDMLVKSNIYEPIVSEELWWKCFDSYRTIKRTHTKQFEYRWSYYELSTIFRCPYCNTGWAHWYYKGKKEVLEKYKSLAHTCNEGLYRDFDKDALEMIVRVSLILTFLDHDEVECFFQNEREKAGIEKNEMETELANTEKMLADIKKKMDKLTDLAVEDLIDHDTLKERMGKLKEDASKLTSNKRALINAITQKEALIDDWYAELSKDVLDEYSNLSPTLRRDTLRKYLAHAYVRKEGFDIAYINGKSFMTDMWIKGKKILNPLVMIVSFKGNEQYKIKLSFQSQEVEILDEDYGDDATNLFFEKRNRHIEQEVNKCLKKMQQVE